MKTNRKNKKNKYEDSDEDYSLSSEYVEEIEEESEYTEEIRDILSYMRTAKLPAPVIYGKGASNGIGFNLDCFLWLRENCPGDLVKIYAEFPLSKRILFEYDRKKKDSDKQERIS